jgi:hypothetical protein
MRDMPIMCRPSGAVSFTMCPDPKAYAMGYRSSAVPRLIFTFDAPSRMYVDRNSYCPGG